MTAEDPFQLRQVQCDDGLYVHAGDLVAFLRARATELAGRADTAESRTARQAYLYASRSYTYDADHLDLSAIGCVTADPAPWLANPRTPNG